MTLLQTPACLTARPAAVDGTAFRLEDAPAFEYRESRYTVRFARSEAEVDAALKLRFEVFNLELNEGLEASFINERDEDRFDKTCHHLLVIENETARVVGTYRVRTLEMAGGARGFYAANEFALDALPFDVLAASLETGRACIAREHRHSRVLFLLWKGLAMYLTARGKRYLFGCCSLASQDFTDAVKAARQLERDGYYHPTLRVAPRAAFAPQPEDYLTADDGADVRLPKLFETYLRLGARVCGAPVIDRQFKTIDFFVIVDAQAIPEKHFRMFFG